MKFFLALFLGLSAWLASASFARAQSDADAQYLTIYTLIQQADTLSAKGQSGDALAAYVDARSQLQKFQKEFPNWEPDVVNYRLNGLSSKVAELNASVPAKKMEMSATNENSVKVDPQVTILQSKLQMAHDENTRLQAKLKEALSIQSAPGADADALTNAQQQIRSLMKENALLKASRLPAANPGPDTNEIASLRAQLDQSAKKLADEAANIQKLTAENGQLKLATNAPVDTQRSGAIEKMQLQMEMGEAVKKYTDEHARAENLAAENKQLKSQLAAAPATVAVTNPVDESIPKLAAMQTQLAAAQSTISAASLEKGALEKKLAAVTADRDATEQRLDESIKKMTEQREQIEKMTAEHSTAQSAADVAALEEKTLDKKLQQMTDQRDELTKKLDQANEKWKTTEAKSSRRQNSDASGQVAKLNDQIATLQARLAVAEAKPVPYSAEELALLSPAAPAAPIKKPADQLPADAKALVASAQAHFSKREYDDAAADYEKVLRRNPNNPVVLGNLAMVELQAGQLDAAEKHIHAALAQNPDDAYNLYTLGSLKLGQKQYDAALDALSRAAKLDPQNPGIEVNIGLALMHKGLGKQAEAAFRKAVVLDPNDANAHGDLAALYLSQNPPSPQLARWDYEKAVAAGLPRNPDLEKMLAEKGAPVSASP